MAITFDIFLDNCYCELPEELRLQGVSRHRRRVPVCAPAGAHRARRAPRGLAGEGHPPAAAQVLPVDTGLRNLPSGFVVRDTDFQLENVVYVELLRRGFAVSVGSVTGKVVDFIARKRDEVLCVQVCESVADDAVLDRELAPLRALDDSFPKLLLIADRLRTGTTPDGIRIANLVDWLLAA